MKSYGIAAAFCVLLLASCSNSAKINGRLTGAVGETVYLEMITPSNIENVDSTATNARGEFSFKVKVPDRQPTFYNLRHAGTLIPLLVAPGEKIEVSSIGGVGYNYTVKGSEGSEQIRRVNTILTEGAASLDSLRKLYQSADGDLRKRKLSEEFMSKYNSTKREHIRFIVENFSSMSAIYALYQRMPGDEVLFNGESDIVYFRMVADSTEARYPDSPYVKALRKAVNASVTSLEAMNSLNGMTVQEINYPEIVMNDMYGNRHSLSALEGKVIVLYFWSTAMPEARLLNAELKDIYEREHERGLEIYQIGLDTDKATWVNAVQQQKLRWINVNDFNGWGTPAVATYNVTNLPTLFLIDRGGNVVAKNLLGDALANKITQLLN